MFWNRTYMNIDIVVKKQFNHSVDSQKKYTYI